MDLDLLWVGVILVVGAAVVVQIVWRSDHLDATMSRISAATRGFYRGARGWATFDGKHFDYEIETGSDGPPTLIVSIAATSSASFQLKRKQDFDSMLLHAIGVTEVSGAPTKVLTGDAGFDHEFSLFCDSAETGRRIFSLPQNREAARRILRRGYNMLKHDRKRVTARMSIENLESLDAEVVTGIAPFLADLAASARQEPTKTLKPG